MLRVLLSVLLLSLPLAAGAQWVKLSGPMPLQLANLRLITVEPGPRARLHYGAGGTILLSVARTSELDDWRAAQEHEFEPYLHGLGGNIWINSQWMAGADGTALPGSGTIIWNNGETTVITGAPLDSLVILFRDLLQE